GTAVEVHVVLRSVNIEVHSSACAVGRKDRARYRRAHSDWHKQHRHYGYTRDQSHCVAPLVRFSEAGHRLDVQRLPAPLTPRTMAAKGSWIRCFRLRLFPAQADCSPCRTLFFVTQEANGHTAFGAKPSVCVFPSFSVSGCSDTLLARRDARIVRLFHL